MNNVYKDLTLVWHRVSDEHLSSWRTDVSVGLFLIWKCGWGEGWTACFYGNRADRFFAGRRRCACTSIWMYILRLYILEVTTLELAEWFTGAAQLFFILLLLRYSVAHNQPSLLVSVGLCGRREWWKEAPRGRGCSGPKKKTAVEEEDKDDIKSPRYFTSPLCLLTTV